MDYLIILSNFFLIPSTSILRRFHLAILSNPNATDIPSKNLRLDKLLFILVFDGIKRLSLRRYTETPAKMTVPLSLHSKQSWNCSCPCRPIGVPIGSPLWFPWLSLIPGSFRCRIRKKAHRDGLPPTRCPTARKAKDVQTRSARMTSKALLCSNGEFVNNNN